MRSAPRERYRRRMWMIACGGVVITALAGAAVAWAWRWVSLPAPREEIDARWRQVEAWATPPSGRGPVDALLEAQGALADGEGPRHDLDDEAPTPRVSIEEAPTGVAAAVDALERWYRGGGGIQMCDPRLDVLVLLRLGRWAFATATRDDLPRARAAVHLAAALRSVGKLTDAVVGILLSEEALRWSADRGVNRQTLGPGLPPRRGEAFEVLARDPVCLLAGAVPPRDGPAVLESREQRELTMVRWYFGDLLARAHPHRDDTVALASFLSDEADRLEDGPPPSALVGVAVVQFPAWRWVDYEQRWDRSDPAR